MTCFMKVSMPPLQASDKSAISSLGELVELRRYRLHPGTREKLITLFDQEFVESQEDEGMRVIGQFRDLDDPDCFVWLRGFADMKARQRALSAFYTGPVWTAHRDAANGTMINSDNILLLRASAPGRGFAPATETHHRYNLLSRPRKRSRLRNLVRNRSATGPRKGRCWNPREFHHRAQRQQLSQTAGARRRERLCLVRKLCQCANPCGAFGDAFPIAGVDAGYSA
jgi:hypothetical protein